MFLRRRYLPAFALLGLMCSLTTDDLIRIARQYGVSYLVEEKPHTQNLPMLYQNERFLVYDLRMNTGTGG